MLIKKLAITGIKWSYVSQFGRELLQLITTLILTRLLSPKDFGLMAMLNVVTAFVLIFSDFGTSAIIVKQKELKEELLSSVFVLNVVVGLASALLLSAASPIIAYLFGQNHLDVYIKALSVNFIVSGISILHKALLERNMRFKLIAGIEITATLIGGIVGIVAAVFDCGTWSLVFLSMTTITVTTILLLFFCNHKFKFAFNWTQSKEVMSFGLNLTGFSVLNFFSRNADNILIGKFLGAESLGYYSLAYRIMFYPLQSISGAIGRVMFPVYAHIQDDNVAVKGVYIRVAACISLVTFPLMMGVWSLSGLLVEVGFGSNWQPVALLLMILAPVGMIQSIQTTVGFIFMIKNRTNLLLYWGVVTGVIEVIGFAIGMRWGIIGVAVSYVILTLMLTYHGFAIPLKLITMQITDLTNALKKPLFASLLMAISISVVKLGLPQDISNVAALLILVPVGVVSYGIISWLINRELIIRLFEDCRA